MALNLVHILRTLTGGGLASVFISTVSAGVVCNEYHEPPRWWSSPACEPAWGYHETCWRRFPPTTPCPEGSYCSAGDVQFGTTGFDDQGRHFQPTLGQPMMHGFHHGGTQQSYGSPGSIIPEQSTGQSFSTSPGYSVSPGPTGSSRYQMPTESSMPIPSMSAPSVSSPVMSAPSISSPGMSSPGMSMPSMEVPNSTGSSRYLTPLMPGSSMGVPMPVQPGPSVPGPIPAAPHQMNPVPIGPIPGSGQLTPMGQPVPPSPQLMNQSSGPRTIIGTPQASRYGGGSPQSDFPGSQLAVDLQPRGLTFQQTLASAKGRYAGIPSPQSFTPPASLRSGQVQHPNFGSAVPVHTVSASMRPDIQPRPPGALPYHQMTQPQVGRPGHSIYNSSATVVPAAKTYR